MAHNSIWRIFLRISRLIIEERACQKTKVGYLASMSATEIMEKVRTLRPSEQLKIADQIWAEWGEGLETPEMLVELDRRAEEFFKNPNGGESWEKVRSDVRQRLGWN